MPPTKFDNDFWWLRYFGGIAVPIFLLIVGLSSIIFQHSYAIWGQRGLLHFVPVEGRQAIIMGAVYLGAALMLFAQCHLQYHEKMAYYYQWPLAVGALVAGGGIIWYTWIVMLS
jgi:hypothetical protein